MTGFDPASQQQIFPSIDFNLAEECEINFGLGAGMTGATGHQIGKVILGYGFNF